MDTSENTLKRTIVYTSLSIALGFITHLFLLFEPPAEIIQQMYLVDYSSWLGFLVHYFLGLWIVGLLAAILTKLGSMTPSNFATSFKVGLLGFFGVNIWFSVFLFFETIVALVKQISSTNKLEQLGKKLQ